MNKTDLFLERINEVGKKEVPQSVAMRAKVALLDYIGVTMAGHKEYSDKVSALLRSFGDGAGDVYPVGMHRPISMNNAVFLNGLNGHALDFDDGTNAGIIHLGSPIFSVLLALAQKNGFDGYALLKAAILGYEASFTMAMTIQPAHKQRGYHATGTCGLLGIAVAASKVLGLNSVQAKAAFSTAALSATGSLKTIEDASELKPYNVAKTALLGLISVQMALAGFDVPDDSLSGTAGYLSQMYGSDDVEFVSTLLGGKYAIEKAYIKPYAACRYTHPAIDIANDMRAKNNVGQADIESVNIKTYSLAVAKHDHTEIKGAASAKMSIPYSFAVAYVTGRTSLDAFTVDCLSNRDVLELTKKVVVEEDSEMTARFPQETRATVDVYLKNGQALSGNSVLPKGEPENPLTLDEAIKKFTDLALYSGKSAKEANELVEAALNVEDRLPLLLKLLR